MSAYRLARVTLVCFAWYALTKSAMLALLWEYGLVGHTSGVFTPVGVDATSYRAWILISAAVLILRVPLCRLLFRAGEPISDSRSLRRDSTVGGALLGMVLLVVFAPHLGSLSTWTGMEGSGFSATTMRPIAPVVAVDVLVCVAGFASVMRWYRQTYCQMTRPSPDEMSGEVITVKAVIDVTVACIGLFVIGNGIAQFFCGRAFSLLDTYSIWFLFDASFYGHEGLDVAGLWSELVGAGAGFLLLLLRRCVVVGLFPDAFLAAPFLAHPARRVPAVFAVVAIGLLASCAIGFFTEPISEQLGFGRYEMPDERLRLVIAGRGVCGLALLASVWWCHRSARRHHRHREPVAS